MMKRNLRKGIAVLMAVITSLSLHAIPILAKEIQSTGNKEEAVKNDAMESETENTFAEMFADGVAAKQDEQEENEGCNIFSIEVNDTEALVEFETTKDTTLIVAIYDESGLEMLGSGETKVSKGEKEKKIILDMDDMPSYFYLRGYLVDSDTLMPVAQMYESPNYTKEMQDFFQKTTKDFEDDRVLNLDDDSTNNFAVYNNNIKLISQTDDIGTVVSADRETNTYVIEDAANEFKSLRSGDTFSYEYGEGNILIATIDTITINGDKVTIVGKNVEMKDVFDYIKIDTSTITRDMVLDTSNSSDDVIYNGMIDERDELERASGESTNDKTLSFSFKDSTGFQGDISIKVKTTLKFYFTENYQYLEYKNDSQVNGDLTVQKSVEKEIPLGVLGISPIPGVFIEIPLAFDIKANGKIDFLLKMTSTDGFSISNDEGIKNLARTPEVKTQLEAEVEIYCGLALKPRIKILSDQIAHAEFDVKVGGEISSKILVASNETTDSKHHDCNKCIEGSIDAKASVGVEVSLFEVPQLTMNLKQGLTLHCLDFYYSFDYNEFAFTKCPHIYYKTAIVVKDSGGQVVNTAKITLPFKFFPNGKKEDVSEIETDKDGVAEGYLSAGTHMAKITAANYQENDVQITVVDGAKRIVVTLQKKIGKPDTPVKPDVPIDPGISSVKSMQIAKMGINGAGAITKNGDLYMWGDGKNTQPQKMFEHVVSMNISDYSGVKGVITEDNSLYTWGTNYWGTVGDGTCIERSEPIKIMDDVVDVEMGAYSVTGAIKKNGDLYIWGTNNNDTYSVLGNGEGKMTSVRPIKIMQHVNSLYIAEDCLTVGAVTEDGSLYMWGKEVKSKSPIKMLDNVKEVYLSGNNYGIITQDGSLYMGGWNNAGQIGDGTMGKNKETPVKVLDEVKSVVIDGGDVESGTATVAAIKTDGSLYMWGANDSGQIGDGTKENKLYPIKIMDNVKEVSMDTSTTGAITEDGSLFTWGYNYWGTTGDGTEGSLAENRTEPKKIMENINLVSIGFCTAMAVAENGDLYTWGRNCDLGKLGNGRMSGNANKPIKILTNVKTYFNYSDSKMAGNSIAEKDLLQSMSSAMNDNGSRTVTFDNLIPDMIYNFYIMKDRETDNSVSSSNLLYIMQAKSNKNGKISISYCMQSESDENDIFIVGKKQSDISQATVEMEKLTENGEQQYIHLVVKLNENVLIEGKDYEVVGDYSARNAGEYTVFINGIHEYTGSITYHYKMLPQNEIEYKIIYKLDGGTNNSGNPVTYKTLDSTIELKSPYKQGYIFSGWYTDASYTKKITEIPAGSMGNLTLYAKWMKKTTDTPIPDNPVPDMPKPTPDVPKPTPDNPSPDNPAPSGTKVATYNGDTFYKGDDGKLRCYDKNGKLVTNEFKFDGTYTYYMQADGTPMKDRLTYHPDGEHIIYLDENGHEAFTNFVYCPSVGYICYFDSNGYLYKDQITFVGDKVYYLNGNGALEQNGWFQFANGLDYGFANSDGTLVTTGFSYDPYGRVVFYHWNGMVARGLISDGVYYYSMDTTDGHYLGQFPVQ